MLFRYPRQSRSRAAESVIHVLLHNLESALRGELPEVVQLRLGVLVYSADSHVQGGSLGLPFSENEKLHTTHAPELPL